MPLNLEFKLIILIWTKFISYVVFFLLRHLNLEFRSNTASCLWYSSVGIITNRSSPKRRQVGADQIVTAAQHCILVALCLRRRWEMGGPGLCGFYYRDGRRDFDGFVGHGGAHHSARRAQCSRWVCPLPIHHVHAMDPSQHNVLFVYLELVVEL